MVVLIIPDKNKSVHPHQIGVLNTLTTWIILCGVDGFFRILSMDLVLLFVADSFWSINPNRVESVSTGQCQECTVVTNKYTITKSPFSTRSGVLCSSADLLCHLSFILVAGVSILCG